MHDALLGHVAAFVNATGDNTLLEGFLPILARSPGSELVVVGLAEKLPDYAGLASRSRKARLEALSEASAVAAIEKTLQSAGKHGVAGPDMKLLEGTFPGTLVEWLESSPTTLLVKESLPCDSIDGNASKGDIKLVFQSPASVLLLHGAIGQGTPVLVGIAPRPDEPEPGPVWVNLVNVAAGLARLWGGSLCVVHSWDLWGETLIGSRAEVQELAEEDAELRSAAEAAVERVLANCNLQGVSVESHFGKGDAARVILGTMGRLQPGLVVLGAASREGIAAALLGSTAETIARHRQTSVLIVK